jgi:hypothetical protein
MVLNFIGAERNAVKPIWLLRYQKCDAFYVGGLGKEVGGLGLNQGIAALIPQNLKIAGQGSGVTAHIDDARGMKFEQGIEHGAIAALAGRIQHYNIYRITQASGRLAQQYPHVPSPKLNIVDAVEPRIGQALGHSLGLNL